MRLYIARHGEASFNAPSDGERPLTPHGVGQTRNVAKQCAAELQEVSAIWASPLRRAQETANVFSRHLGIEIITQPFLMPDSDPQRVVDKLSAAAEESTLLIVSHQPLVGELVSLLVAGNIYESYPFSTSELVTLEFEQFGAGLAKQRKNYLPD